MNSPLHPASGTSSSPPARLGRVQRLMARQGVEVMVCFKPENSFYLSGFNPIIYSHPVIAIVAAGRDPIMLVHALRDDHGRASAWVADIRLYGAWSNKVTLGPNWLDALASILRELGVASGRVGIEEDFLPLRRFAQLKQALPQATFSDVTPLIEQARLIKDADEIVQARIAARIADCGMAAAIEATVGGGSEREISIASMEAMNRLWLRRYPQVEVCDFGSLEGGVQNGLWTWALAGDRLFYNCDNPTLRKPRRGETVAVFIWSIANGIHAENERIIAYGPLPAEHRRAIDAILAIRAEVDALIRPGMPYRELFEQVKSRLEARGYGNYIPGRIGHGIGIGAHEHSSLDAHSPLVLEPGMIFTFEPNLRIPGVGGTQISDTVLITDTGREYLTQSPGGYIEV
ncbi:M24 family metallopeptidase [Brenneria tiliae]|uniref:M24 family metallopeptidase n=1 Tax=Brenneria tiliae TaxID=2914984 RepID=UPI002014C2FD|nr:Xaa-Pro peptidase family protein [Brenneria tiliae]MCL2896883.1 Xaa-Pro peptidase family protein [Brenneria tiliae]MCL2901441.1 Xaa-Pro peptidase family protein [Brenneria tiliae]